MKKIILLSALLSSSLFANTGELPPPDFSSVDACMQNMMNAEIATESFHGMFDAAASSWAGTYEYGHDDDNCKILLGRVSVCRITGNTNDGDPWRLINYLIVDKFKVIAQSTLKNAVSHYNATKQDDAPKYFTITCDYKCSRGLDVDRDCVGSLVD